MDTEYDELMLWKRKYTRRHRNPNIIENAQEDINIIYIYIYI
jgi:hypothetical protein